MNKNLATNLTALIVFLVGFFLNGNIGNIMETVGLFALSGAITNWLAIQMLFEKIPFLIGSGVIQNRFQEFKISIKKIVLNNFFNEKNFKEFKAKSFKDLNLEKIISKIEPDDLFNSLSQEIQKSKLMPLLSMVGGISILETFREKFVAIIKKKVEKITSFIDSDKNYQNFYNTISLIINNELEKLTPQKVKQMVAEIIKEHLGWLVVWGGFFGAIIGLVYSLLQFSNV